MTAGTMIHQDVLYQPGVYDAVFIRDWLDGIIERHDPTNGCPDPVVSISERGIYVRWTSKGWSDDAPHERVGKGQLPG